MSRNTVARSARSGREGHAALRTFRPTRRSCGTTRPAVRSLARVRTTEWACGRAPFFVVQRASHPGVQTNGLSKMQLPLIKVSRQAQRQTRTEMRVSEAPP